MCGLQSAIARRRAFLRRASLAAGAVSLALVAAPAVALAAQAAPDLVPGLSEAAPGSMAASSPEPPRLAYLTETATGAPKVWIAAANGSGAKLLGPGQQPLLAPNGSPWRWRCLAP